MPEAPAGRRLIAVAAVAMGGGTAAGTGAGALAFLAMRPAPGEDRGFESLGAALGAVFVGTLLGAAVFAAIVVAGVRRSAPPGARLRPAVALLVSPVVLSLAGSIGAAPGLPSPYGAIHVVPVAALLVVAVLALGWLAGRPRTPTARRVATVAGVTGAVTLAVAVALYPAAQRADVRRQYEQSDVRLALVDGTTLQAPFAGWRVRHVQEPRWSERVVVEWEVPGGDHASLELTPDGWNVTVYRNSRRDRRTEATLRARLRPASVEEFVRAAERAQS